ncbi:MAG: hypothetical protein M1839_004073 [Geoglossum umbratile]|nr:MAG: hypothetical protein M1839_004073 [Geoglossum umbratile]
MRKPRVELLILPFLLPYSSAISLASFQVIITNSLSSACLRAYEAEIPGCDRPDFSPGPCSTACTAGLQLTGNTVKQACGAVAVSSSTVLGVVLDGKILSALCPTVASSSAPISLSAGTEVNNKPTTSPTSTPPSTSASTSPSTSTSDSASSSPSSQTSSLLSTSTRIASTQSSISINTNVSYITSLPDATRRPPTATPLNPKPSADGSPFGASAQGGGTGRERNPRGLAALALIGAAAVIWWF